MLDTSINRPLANERVYWRAGKQDRPFFPISNFPISWPIGTLFFLVLGQDYNLRPLKPCIMIASTCVRQETKGGSAVALVDISKLTGLLVCRIIFLPLILINTICKTMIGHGLIMSSIVSLFCARATITRAHSGLVMGSKMLSTSGRQFLAFRGIPYAQPPVGSLRFQVRTLPQLSSVRCYWIRKFAETVECHR